VLRDSRDVPFLNRATRGLYPPASTIKPFLALGALAAKATTWNYKVPDPGFYILPTDETIKKRDWKEGGHANFVDLMDAIIESCDTYFYDLAFRMKLEAMHDSLEKFGFGMNTTLDVGNMRTGINPSRDWKKARHGFSWFAGDSVNLGIGQGYILVNPVQMAVATTTLVNNGEWIVPKLVDTASAPIRSALNDNIPESLKLPKSDWDKMKRAMRDVLHSSKGTARGTGYGSKFLMAGKTGTAQTFSLGADEVYEAADIDERLRDHGWFTGFAPYEDPSIVVTVFMENGEHGSAMAPIARQMFESWILRGDKR
jgi:penicillin-binding protein 2